MRLLFLSLLLLLTAAFADAQVFSNLTTDYTGSQLYFTSNLRLKGSDDDGRPKLYRWKSGSFEKIAEAEQLNNGPSPLTYGIGGPQLSSDGLLAAWSLTAQSTAALTPSTGKLYLNHALVENADANSGFAICRNGPWIAFATQGRSTPLTLTVRQRITHVDRIITTDTVAGLPANWQIANENAWLTNEGAVLVRWQDAQQLPHLGVIESTGLRELKTTKPAYSAVIDPTGHWVAYLTGTANQYFSVLPNGLRAFDLTTNTDREVVLAGYTTPIQSVLFDDMGQTVTVKPSGAQVRLADLAITQLGLPANTLDFTVSGDNSRLFALTYSGKLLREDLFTGKVDVLSGKTVDPPLISTLVPGSLASAAYAVPAAIKVFGETPGEQFQLTSAASFQFGAFLDVHERGLSAPSTPTYQSNGFSVFVNDTPVPLWSITTTELRFQLPWSIPVTSPRATLRLVSADSPFELVKGVRLAPQLIQFETAASALGPKIVHQDNRGFVTTADPAVPGEIVQAYVTGLNLASAPPPEATLPATALPALDPGCLLYSNAGVGVRAAMPGQAFLSPQYLGIFQVNFTVPDVTPGLYLIGCSGPLSNGSLNYFGPAMLPVKARP